MALETYTGKIADLVVTNPTPTDPKSQGDDHLRGIKYTLQQSFPGFDGPLNAARVPFTPAGNIAANNVQAAVQELDTEKVSLAALGAQTWQRPPRIAGTNYTNTTNLPIQVSIICTSPSAGTSAMGLFCDGIQIAASYATFNANEAMLQGTIPPGGVYGVNGIGGPVSTLTWNELR